MIAPTCAFFFARFSGVKFPLSEIIPDRIARDELARCKFSVLGILTRIFNPRRPKEIRFGAIRSLSDKTRRDLDLSRNSAKFARPLEHKLAPICNSLIIAVISHAGHRRFSFFPPLPYSPPVELPGHVTARGELHIVRCARITNCNEQPRVGVVSSCHWDTSVTRNSIQRRPCIVQLSSFDK